MIIDCIADLHGFYPELEGGDLLIVAGDLTAKDTLKEFENFYSWLINQKYSQKIFIAGNHDNTVERLSKAPCWDLPGITYLFDSGTEFEGLKIWGSPWTLKFPGMNQKCMAFTCDTEEQLAEKWEMIPDDIDILITHSSAYGMQDRTIRNECVGSKSLQMKLFNDLNPKLFVFGHIHEAYGIAPPGLIEGCHVVNCSYVNENYKPVNKPIRVIL